MGNEGQVLYWMPWRRKRQTAPHRREVSAMGNEGQFLWMPWRRKRQPPNNHDDVSAKYHQHSQQESKAGKLPSFLSAEYHQPSQQESNPEAAKPPSFFSIAKTVLFTRRRLRITPNKHLHFLYEPGKQVSSALEIKNTSGSIVAFKLQTNSPKSCFIRPPSCMLQPGETVIVSVVKFIEPDENKQAKIKQWFKVVSLKVKQGVQYTPELFEEQKELLAIEKNLEVVYLDPHSKSRDIEKLKKRLAEAEAAQQARKKSVEGKVQKTVAAGGVVDEWKEQRREN